MFCEKCGNKLNGDDSFCSNCGAEKSIKDIKNNQTETQLIDYNNRKIINSSTISFGIFIIIILANMIVYPLSLTDNMTSGMGWFFFVFLPSIPMFNVSLIMAIISVVNYIKGKKTKKQYSTFNKIFIVLNIIQLIIMIPAFILICFKILF